MNHLHQNNMSSFRDKFREWYPKFLEMVQFQISFCYLITAPQNDEVGAGNKEEIKEYVMKLDKTMVTEFNDILIVCFTLHMPGNNINLFTPTKIFIVI